MQMIIPILEVEIRVNHILLIKKINSNTTNLPLETSWPSTTIHLPPPNSGTSDRALCGDSTMVIVLLGKWNSPTLSVGLVQ